MATSTSSKRRSKRIAIFATGLFALILSFQNCAPAPMGASSQNSVDASSDGDGVAMSKVLVTLQPPDGAVLSNVQLVADDVNTAMNEFSVHKNSVHDLAATTVEATTSPSAFSLDLPLGEQKIIVARAQLHDTATGLVSNVYGNTVVTVNEALGNVTINLVVLP